MHDQPDDDVACEVTFTRSSDDVWRLRIWLRRPGSGVFQQTLEFTDQQFALLFASQPVPARYRSISRPRRDGKGRKER